MYDPLDVCIAVILVINLLVLLNANDKLRDIKERLDGKGKEKA